MKFSMKFRPKPIESAKEYVHEMCILVHGLSVNLLFIYSIYMRNPNLGLLTQCANLRNAPKSQSTSECINRNSKQSKFIYLFRKTINMFHRVLCLFDNYACL